LLYNATNLFKSAISSMNRDLRIRCTIDDKVYEDSEIQYCSTEESILTSEDFKLGSATASTFELTLLNMDDSLSAKSFEGKEVQIEIGAVLDKFSQPIEYVSMGSFLVEKGNKEKTTIKLTGYDMMILFEKPYVSSLTYPATLQQILQEACSLSGVELETTTFLNHDYIVNEKPNLDNVSRRQVLEYISELACSYACINRSGKVELVTFSETDIQIDSDNYYSMNLSEYEYGGIDHVVIDNEGVLKEVGTGTNVIEIKDNIFALNPTDLLINNIYNAIENFKFKPFNTTWQGNVLTAPGDLINVSYKDGEVYKSFIAKQKFTYSTGLKCEVTTNAKTVIQSEYKSGGTLTQKIEKTKNELRSKIEFTDEKFTQEFERVDQSISTIEQDAETIKLSVKGLDDRMGEAEASIELTSEQISLKVSKDGVISAINQTAEQITIDASKVNLNGYVTITNLSTPGQTIIDGGNILTGTMSADRIFGGWLRFSNFSSLYEINEPYTTLVFSSGGYTFEAGGTVDFQNNEIRGLNVVASFG
jgi:hypothetical protein